MYSKYIAYSIYSKCDILHLYVPYQYVKLPRHRSTMWSLIHTMLLASFLTVAASQDTTRDHDQCYSDDLHCMYDTFQRMQHLLRDVQADFQQLRRENQLTMHDLLRDVRDDIQQLRGENQKLKDHNRNLTANLNLLWNKVSQLRKSSHKQLSVKLCFTTPYTIYISQNSKYHQLLHFQGGSMSKSKCMYGCLSSAPVWIP